MYQSELIAVQLPTPMLAVGLVLWLAVALRAIQGQSLAFRFLYLSFSARYLVNFFHETTSLPLVMGQSISSLVTLTIIAGGLFLTRHWLARYKVLLPVYFFCFVLAYSGIYNGEIAGAFTSLLRQMMFISILLLFAKVLDAEVDDGRFTQKFLTIFQVPLFFQLLSVIFNVATFHELDGVASFIGGYIHEGVFSTMLLAGLSVAVLSSNLTWKHRTFYVFIFFVAIIVANYRTAFLAALPILLAHFVVGSGQGFRADIAVAVRTIVIFLLAILGALLLAVMAERLADIATVVSDLTGLFKPPSEFGEEDRRLLSGRLLIWSHYVFTTISGDLGHIVLGFGPEAWTEAFGLYAHNVYISYIYEIGFLGLAAYVAVTFAFFWLALTSRHPRRWTLVGCHAGYFILSLGTMPNFVIEGVLLYGVICGYTLHYKISASRRDELPLGPGGTLIDPVWNQSFVKQREADRVG